MSCSKRIWTTCVQCILNPVGQSSSGYGCFTLTTTSVALIVRLMMLSMCALIVSLMMLSMCALIVSLMMLSMCGVN